MGEGGFCGKRESGRGAGVAVSGRGRDTSVGREVTFDYRAIAEVVIDF